MKKKKIISIISSILCSFAFVGLFAIGLVLEHKQKPQQASASSSQVVYVNAFNNEVNVTNGDYHSVMYFNGLYRYYRTFVGGVPNYSYYIEFTLYCDFYVGSDVYRYNLTSYDDTTVLQSTGLFTDTFTEETNYLSFNFENYGSNVPDSPIRCSYQYVEGGAYKSLYFSYDLYPLDSNNQLPSGYSVYNYLMFGSAVHPTLPHILIFDETFTPSDLNEYQTGYVEGYNEGYNQGNGDGLETGYQNGYTSGYSSGYADGESLSESYYSQGYSAGYSDAESQDGAVNSIFSGITTVALVPINFFLSIFNFEILGVNIASVVSALMSICLILIVWRAVMGGKSND